MRPGGVRESGMPGQYLVTLDSGPEPAMPGNPEWIASCPARPQFPYGIKGSGQMNTATLPGLVPERLSPVACCRGWCV